MALKVTQRLNSILIQGSANDLIISQIHLWCCSSNMGHVCVTKHKYDHGLVQSFQSLLLQNEVFNIALNNMLQNMIICVIAVFSFWSSSVHISSSSV